PRSVDRDSNRRPELSRSCGTAVAAETVNPIARDRGDDPGRRIDASDPVVVARLSREDVPRDIDGDIQTVVETGSRCGSTIPAEARRPVSGNRGDDSRSRVYAPKAFVGCAADEHAPRRVDADAIGIVELGSGRGPAVAAETERAVPCDGRDRARRRVHAAD